MTPKCVWCLTTEKVLHSVTVKRVTVQICRACWEEHGVRLFGEAPERLPEESDECPIWIQY